MTHIPTRKGKKENKLTNKNQEKQEAVYPTICNHIYHMLLLLFNGKDCSWRPINEWHC